MDNKQITSIQLIASAVLLCAYGCLAVRPTAPPCTWDGNDEIETFRTCLRIATVQPNVNYTPAVDFLKTQANRACLPVTVHYPVDNNNPVLVMKWEGSEPNLPAIVLNSHMDVVPVFPEFWKHPPYATEIEENGDIYARGTQDMKAAGLQYLAAIRKLKESGICQLKRTIYVVYVPDEELNGLKGWATPCLSEEFRAMNVGFVLDEGGAFYHDKDEMDVYYSERTLRQVNITFIGNSGHGAFFIPATAAQKLSYFLGKIYEFRDQEAAKFNAGVPYRNVTTINLTEMKGGVAINEIPAELSAAFDIRVSVYANITDFEAMIQQWADEAGGNIKIDYLAHDIQEKLTTADDSNPFWVALKKGANDSGIPVHPAVLSATSDAKYVRRVGIPAFGFSPVVGTIARMHDNNEYINACVFLNGINVFKNIITELANV